MVCKTLQVSLFQTAVYLETDFFLVVVVVGGRACAFGGSDLFGQTDLFLVSS